MSKKLFLLAALFSCVAFGCTEDDKHDVTTKQDGSGNQVIQYDGNDLICRVEGVDQTPSGFISNDIFHVTPVRGMKQFEGREDEIADLLNDKKCPAGYKYCFALQDNVYACSQCAKNELFCNGKCYNVLSDAMHCGSCSPCSDGMICSNAQCKDRASCSAPGQKLADDAVSCVCKTENHWHDDGGTCICDDLRADDGSGSCVCDSKLHRIQDSSDSCVCDNSNGWSEIDGVCACEPGSHKSDNGNGVCACDASAHWKDNGSGTCVCEADRVSNGDSCVCDAGQNLVEKDGSCVCNEGYYHSSAGTCEPLPVVGGTIVMGNYKRESDSVAKPVTWIVLDKVDDNYLVLSKDILDEGKFYDKPTKHSWLWSDSSTKSWCNVFYNMSFNDEEAARILKVNLATETDYYNSKANNPCNEYNMCINGTCETCSATEHCSCDQVNVFILSVYEAVKYSNYTKLSDCPNGWWVRVMYDKTTNDKGGTWRRLSYVTADGKVTHADTSEDMRGLRPAMWVHFE